jgi:Fic family protein
MRTFERTHPWLKFQLDLRDADWTLWMHLGEVASKCEHLAGAPLRPDVAAEVHQIFLAKGAGATTAIEGNTLTEEEVLRHIRGTLELPPSQAYLMQEVDNIVDACNAISQAVVGPGKNPDITPELICHYNRQVLRKLDVRDEVDPGALRKHSVVVGNVYRGAPAEDCEFLLAEMCSWLGKDFTHPDKEMRLPLAVVKAAIAHLYLAWIHPFGDGNGRTARLLEFHILLEAGVPLPAAHLLSDHYNRTRTEYYRQLDRASKSGGNVIPFICYACRGMVDGLRQQISLVRAQQQRVAWENHVHEVFRERKSSDTQKRQRDLVLALGEQPGFVEVSKIPDLNSRLARAYAHLTPKAVQRDLNEIEKTGLVVRTHGRVRAKREIILAFLPARAAETGAHGA